MRVAPSIELLPSVIVFVICLTVFQSLTRYIFIPTNKRLLLLLLLLVAVLLSSDCTKTSHFHFRRNCIPSWLQFIIVFLEVNRNKVYMHDTDWGY